MWTRIGLALAVLLSGVAPAFADGFVETSGAYAEGAPMRGDRYDTGGNKKVTLGTLLAGEDQSNNVMRVEGQFSYKAPVVADAQVKASAGFLHCIWITQNDAAPTAGTIIIYDNTAESGTQVFNWTLTTAVFNPIVLCPDIVMATGIYIGFTTTADVNVSVSYR